MMLFWVFSNFCMYARMSAREGWLGTIDVLVDAAFGAIVVSVDVEAADIEAEDVDAADVVPPI